MARDIPKQPAYENFSIKRRFEQFKSRPSKFKKTCAHKRQIWVPAP